jgi:hypothetical protein
MASGVVFNLDGIKALKDVFGQIPGVIQQPLQNLERTTAYAVKARAQGFAPRDKGDLINAISAQKSGQSWIVGLLDVSLPSRGGNTAHQHPSVYGVWYEYGFTHRKIARHSFMRPAAEATTPEWLAGVDRLWREIENAAAALGGGS